LKGKAAGASVDIAGSKRPEPHRVLTGALGAEQSMTLPTDTFLCRVPPDVSASRSSMNVYSTSNRNMGVDDTQFLTLSHSSTTLFQCTQCLRSSFLQNFDCGCTVGEFTLKPVDVKEQSLSVLGEGDVSHTVHSVHSNDMILSSLAKLQQPEHLLDRENLQISDILRNSSSLEDFSSDLQNPGISKNCERVGDVPCSLQDFSFSPSPNVCLFDVPLFTSKFMRFACATFLRCFIPHF